MLLKIGSPFFKKMIKTVLIFVNLLFNFASADFDCNGTDTLTDALPAKYRVSIEAVVSTEKDNKSFSINEFRNDDQKQNLSSVYQINQDNQLFIWLFRNESNSFINGTTCKTESWAPNVTKFDQSILIDPLFDHSDPVVTFNDLWQRIIRNNNVTEIDTKNVTWSADIPVKYYSGCSIGKDNVALLKYYITMSNFSIPGLGSAQKPVPLLIELKVYKNKTDPTPSQHIVYRLSYGSTFTQADEEKFLPPNGVHCDGFSADKTKKMPVFPSAFSVKSEYVDVSTGNVDYLQTLVDNDRHLVSFDYTRNLTDRPLSYGFSLKDGNYKIVHDFNTGLQYVVDVTKDACAGVSPISLEAGDSEITDKTAVNKTIEIKNAFNALFVAESVDFSYIGQRSSINSLMDVWTARSNKSTEEGPVYEIWTYSANWTFGQSTVKNLPAMLRVYSGAGEKRKLTSQQRFFDYNEEKSVPKICIRPCLSLVSNSSYLVVQLQSPVEMSTVNQESLENSLRTFLAVTANVSWLRISGFYFQPMSDRTVFVFFLLANRSDINGTNTKWSQPEIDITLARERLNVSLTEKDLEFELDGKKFTLVKKTLNFVPPYFYPGGSAPVIEPKKGFSGGSLAVMGIFMFIFGSAAGFALAFFLWKRNRGGIQYEVYQ